MFSRYWFCREWDRRPFSDETKSRFWLDFEIEVCLYDAKTEGKKCFYKKPRVRGHNLSHKALN